MSENNEVEYFTFDEAVYRNQIFFLSFKMQILWAIMCFFWVHKCVCSLDYLLNISDFCGTSWFVRISVLRPSTRERCFKQSNHECCDPGRRESGKAICSGGVHTLHAITIISDNV